MKALTTAGLTKLIQLIKSSFISNTDTVTTNTVTLATVATSGSYNDLSNKPTIPTVDQTYDGTSTNAQSGVAIAGAGFLQNAATGSNSIAILGTSSYNYATALGYNANANDTSTVAIGSSSFANYQQATAVGTSAQATASGTVAIGGSATATAARAHAFGYLSEASASGATALGYEAKATASGALQIGTGTNTTANSLQVSSYTLLDTSTGLIPDARISSNIARTSAIPDISTKQDTLVSGTNIKTINNTSLLGSGNIDTSEIFIATGTTTYAEITSALANDKTVFYKNGNIYYQYTYSTATEHQFTSVITLYSNDIRVDFATINTSNIWNFTTYPVADTDLSNLSSTGKAVIDGQWEATSQAVISSNTSLNGSTNLTYRIDLPNDNQKYEVMMRAICTTNSTSGNEVALLINGNEDTASRYVCRARAAQPGTWYCSGTVICVMSYVASNQKNLTVSRASNYNGNCTELRAIAYRRIGSNT